MKNDIKREIDIIRKMSIITHSMDILKNIYPEAIISLADEYIKLKKELFDLSHNEAIAFKNNL